MRPATLAVLALASCGGPQEQSFDVFVSMPGPFFQLSEQQPVVDFLVAVTASPSAFPPEGDHRELLEIELDVEALDFAGADRLLVGRLARVAPDQRTVLPSTVAVQRLGDRATLVLTDWTGYSPCIGPRCEKWYAVRFVSFGLGALRTRWFLRAGVEWLIPASVPEEAALTLEVFRL